MRECNLRNCSCAAEDCAPGLKKVAGIAAGITATVAAGAVLYIYLIRPWRLSWQTTP